MTLRCPLVCVLLDTTRHFSTANDFDLQPKRLWTCTLYVYVSHAHVLYVHTQLISLSLSLVLTHIHSSRSIMYTYVSLQVMHACTCVQRQLLYTRLQTTTQFNSQACVSIAFWLLVVTYCLLVTEQKKLYFL